MNKLNKTHFFIAVFLNLLCIAYMVHTAWKGNDKTILVVIFGYGLLMLINILIGLSLLLFKKKDRKIYGIIITGLFILYLPVLLLAGTH